MPRPNLLHPVPVVIEILDHDRPADLDAREPIHGARGSTVVTIQAQVQWGSRNAPRPEATGVDESSDGYILVRVVDVKARGIALKRGDRITAMGAGDGLQTGLDLFLTKSQPTGHWPDQGGMTLIRWHFEDRGAVRGVAEVR